VLVSIRKSSSFFTKVVSSIHYYLSWSIVSHSRRLDQRLDDEPFRYSFVSLPGLFICNTQASHPFMYFRIYKYIKIKGNDRGKCHSERLFENIYLETTFFQRTESKWICLFDFWRRFRSNLEGTVNYLTLTNQNNYAKLDSVFELFWSDSEGVFFFT
jgi:hypothetical protein